jgi:hypothetical protein
METTTKETPEKIYKHLLSVTDLKISKNIYSIYLNFDINKDLEIYIEEIVYFDINPIHLIIEDTALVTEIYNFIKNLIDLPAFAQRVIISYKINEPIEVEAKFRAHTRGLNALT